jgi:hypothetical protein
MYNENQTEGKSLIAVDITGQPIKGGDLVLLAVSSTNSQPKLRRCFVTKVGIKGKVQVSRIADSGNKWTGVYEARGSGTAENVMHSNMHYIGRAVDHITADEVKLLLQRFRTH